MISKFFIAVAIILIFLVMKDALAQGTGFVTLKGKQFYDENGNPFYPMVCNYQTRLFYDVNGNPTPIIAPEHHYGPSNSVECLNQTDCFSQFLADFMEIKDIGFNAVRVTMNGCEYNPVLDRIEYPVVKPPHLGWGPISYIIINPPYDYTSNQASYDLIFSFFDGLHQAAVSAEVYVIWLINANGFESDEANLATAAIDKVIANHCRNFTNTLAYDLCNEPTPAPNWTATKEWCCNAVNTMYDAIKDPVNGDPNHLVTIGANGPDMCYFFDHNFLNVDFMSMHSYALKLPNSITYSQSDFRNIVLGQMFWLSQVSNKPYIIGETGFRADPVTPISNVDGNVLDQFNFAKETVELCVKCGYSGYSWWNFQDTYDVYDVNDIIPPFDIIRNPYGVLYADMPYLRKPLCNYFQNLAQNGIGSITGNCTKPGNYDSDIGLLLIPTSSQTLEGVVKINNSPAKNAFIQSRNLSFKFNSIGQAVLEEAFNTAYTNSNGEFKVSPIPSESGLDPADPIHELKITAAGSSRIMVAGSQLINNSTYDLTSLNFKYDDLIDGISITQDESFSSWNNLQVMNITVNTNLNIEFTARANIKLDPETDFNNGSEVHVYTSETFIDCEEIPLRIINPTLDDFPDDYSLEQKYLYINFIPAFEKFTLFPNPCHDASLLTYYGTSEFPLNVFLTDPVGRIISSYTMASKSISLDLSGFSSGLYHLQIWNNEIQQHYYLIRN